MTPGSVVVQPGRDAWRLARQAYGAGMRYTVIYQANRETIPRPRPHLSGPGAYDPETRAVNPSGLFSALRRVSISASMALPPTSMMTTDTLRMVFAPPHRAGMPFISAQSWHW